MGLFLMQVHTWACMIERPSERKLKVLEQMIEKIEAKETNSSKSKFSIERQGNELKMRNQNSK